MKPKFLTLWFICVLSMSGCGEANIPKNAVGSDVKVLSDLGDSLENASWSAEGRVISLDVSGETVTDDVAAKISQLREMRMLALHGTRITRNGLSQLTALSKLEALSLSDTCLSNDDLELLLRCRELSVLDLSRTCVTDDGVIQLSQLPNLRRLFLSGASVSSQAVEEFKRKKPDCIIQVN